MPKTPIDYSKSVIYKIEHIEKPELVYVGSTTNFIRRKCNHKSSCYNINSKDYNYKLYKMIRDNGNWESFKIMIICEFSCNNKIELLIEEEKYRKELQTTLNTLKAYRTTDEDLEYYINYRIQNKEKIKEKDKKYYNNNKEKLNEQSKEYYKVNIDKIKELFNCNCGGKFSFGHKSRHERSKKHINFINNNLEQCNDIEISTS